jgi:hypothetical protein
MNDDTNNEDYLDDDELSIEQQQLVLQTYIDFTRHFAEYVKQVDPSLFKRAKEYATDYTQMPGISIVEETDLPPEEE